MNVRGLEGRTQSLYGDAGKNREQDIKSEAVVSLQSVTAKTHR